MNCKKCNSLVHDNVKFCTKCGSKIEHTNETALSLTTLENTKTFSSSPVNKDKKTINSIVIALVPLTIFFVIIYKIEYPRQQAEYIAESQKLVGELKKRRDEFEIIKSDVIACKYPISAIRETRQSMLKYCEQLSPNNTQNYSTRQNC